MSTMSEQPAATIHVGVNSSVAASAIVPSSQKPPRPDAKGEEAETLVVESGAGAGCCLAPGGAELGNRGSRAAPRSLLLQRQFLRFGCCLR